MGQYVSGEAAADALSVSRTAVWKAVNALRQDGYIIQAETNKGYILENGTDILSAAIVSYHLKGEAAKKLRIEKYDLVQSTNSLVRDRAFNGESEGLVAVAETQTEGRGRKGRTYFSPAGTGLYMSILLRPTCSVSDSYFLTAAAASATARAIEKISGRNAQIKWVNDVFLNGKKVCGILTEAAVALENTHLDYAVVGIGVNVFEPEEGFPAEISDVAVAVFRNGKTDGDVRARLAAEILNVFWDYYLNIGRRTFFDDYKKRSVAIGKDITVIGASGSRPARAIELDNDCRLIVRYDDGTVEALNSGEISIKL